ncbi:uncharacterized protein [Montipora capricornis]|uniref:uncharacterized protein n=1 Tax=Montipora capricornis TaxID=246305 RepID=UPI0035F17116
MKVTRQLTVVLALVVFCCAASADMHYASLMSSDGTFELKWGYRDDTVQMLYFMMKCKNTGWCGVGFSSMGNGTGMKDYDIAIGGYEIRTLSGYLGDYWSTTTETPDIDAVHNLDLECSSEINGYTMVHFKKPAITSENMRDVQFTPNTTVWVMYAMQEDDIAIDDTSFMVHSKKGRWQQQYNLIAMALAADGDAEGPDTVFGDCGRVGGGSSSASTTIFSGTCAAASFLFYLIAHFVLSS